MVNLQLFLAWPVKTKLQILFSGVLIIAPSMRDHHLPAKTCDVQSSQKSDLLLESMTLLLKNQLILLTNGDLP